MRMATVEFLGRDPLPFGPVDWSYSRRSTLGKWLTRGVAATLLIAATPVILLAAVLIRLTSRGPVIYPQVRLGLRGRTFTLYKLRTMYTDSERDGPRWCTPGDPRVTPVGRILRRTHLDELPQLWNILKGDMALVGPRPERPEIAAELARALPEHPLRLRVLPGLTGLAQVLQSPDTSLFMVQSKLALDLHYIRERGGWLDLRILVATVPHVLGVPAGLIARVFGFPRPNTLRIAKPIAP